jgi:hypothetical protein
MKDDLHQLSTSLESVGKLFAISFGLLYLTGFLIVTFHLSRYGILTLSLVRTQYVITGLYFFVPCAGIYLMVVGALRKIASKKERFLDALKSRKALSIIAEIFFGFIDIIPLGVYALVCLGILVDFFSIHPVPVSGWTIVRLVAAVVLFGGFIHGTIDEVLLFIKNPLGYFNTRKVFDDFVPRVAFLLIFGLGLTAYFAYRIYPLIPYEDGGGRPLPVIFVLKENAAAKGAITQDANGKASIPYGLLMESADAYFVVSQDKDQRSIELKKDAVQALVILNRK